MNVHVRPQLAQRDRRLALVLQGGSALGAYQAGVRNMPEARFLGQVADRNVYNLVT